MGYWSRIKYSFAKVWESPALLSVLLLEFMILVLLGILFYQVDRALLIWMNADTLAMMQTFDWHMLLNSKTMIVGFFILVLQGLIFVYVDSFFKAGFYGMLKNTVHDGSTTFHEFMPMAKRYWYALFRFLLLRFAILTVISLPFIISFIMYNWTTPQFVTSGQELLWQVTFWIGLLLGLFTFFVLLWGEAVIVFEDADALDALKTSFKMVKKNKMKAIIAMITFLWIVIVAIIVSSIISVPFEMMATRLPPEPGFEIGQMTPEWQVINGVVDFLLNILTIAGTIVGSQFIFLIYFELTTGKTKIEKPEKEHKKSKHHS